jgi:hypothetical protein
VGRREGERRDGSRDGKGGREGRGGERREGRGGKGMYASIHQGGSEELRRRGGSV